MVPKYNGSIDPKDLSICFEKSLGRGGMAHVFMGFWKERKVAIKCYQEESFIQREHQVLYCIRHPNIVHYFGCAEDERFRGPLKTWCPRVLVMEYLQGESLYSIIERRHFLSCQDKLSISQQLLHVVDFLHSSPNTLCFQPKYECNDNKEVETQLTLLHRDIKLSNLFWNRWTQTLTLFDFGLAVVVLHQQKEDDEPLIPLEEVFSGTRTYFDPSILHDFKQCQKGRIQFTWRDLYFSEMWMIGCVLYTLWEHVPKPHPDLPSSSSKIFHRTPKPMRTFLTSCLLLKNREHRKPLKECISVFQNLFYSMSLFSRWKYNVQCYFFLCSADFWKTCSSLSPSSFHFTFRSSSSSFQKKKNN